MSIISGKYDAKELRDAADRLHTTVEMVLGAATASGPWDTFELERFAISVNYRMVSLGMVIENARAHKETAEAALKDLRAKLDGIPVAGEDDTITAAELKEALWDAPQRSVLGYRSRTQSDGFADQIFKHAADSREPEYSPGTVVRDAKGDVFQRTSSGAWFMFGLAHAFAHDIPKRPLEVV